MGERGKITGTTEWSFLFFFYPRWWLIFHLVPELLYFCLTLECRGSPVCIPNSSFFCSAVRRWHISTTRRVETMPDSPTEEISKGNWLEELQSQMGEAEVIWRVETTENLHYFYCRGNNGGRWQDQSPRAPEPQDCPRSWSQRRRGSCYWEVTKNRGEGRNALLFPSPSLLFSPVSYTGGSQ